YGRMKCRVMTPVPATPRYSPFRVRYTPSGRPNRTESSRSATQWRMVPSATRPLKIGAPSANTSNQHSLLTSTSKRRPPVSYRGAEATVTAGAAAPSAASARPDPAATRVSPASPVATGSPVTTAPPVPTTSPVTPKSPDTLASRSMPSSPPKPKAASDVSAGVPAGAATGATTGATGPAPVDSAAEPAAPSDERGSTAER